MNYQEILDRLILARKTAGLSQGQVGKMFDMSIMWLSDIERGKTPLSVEVLIKLVEIYDCSIEWVFTGVNPYFDPQRLMEHATRLGEDADNILQLFTMLDNNKAAKHG